MNQCNISAVKTDNVDASFISLRTSGTESVWDIRCFILVGLS